ncbi:MAG: S8 family serine peptidase, partial [Candidatus Marinimicrobia bacterium]|nr:S8 family serine peptidase [Candidatus Neomarinimicrobiota bacterium]
MRNIFITIFLLSGIFAQDYESKYVLVKLDRDVNKSEFRAVLDPAKYVIEKTVVRRLGIYRIQIIKHQLTAPMAVEELRNYPWVEKAQLDHKVTPRQTFPDDNEFSGQWDKHNTGQNGGTPDADIDAPEAWDITTGGVNALGDTIVVAVVDGGMMLTHTDLVPNLWTNYNEIPGNNIDDDNNGYIDDIHGWDAYSSDGSIPGDGHGTHVGGIIGAKGNNGSMVTGVNWDVKIMAIAGSSSNTSTVLEAYGYALDQRAMYDSTNGALGAFVVATNSSFGIDFADCNSGDYILWNDMYDAMGEYGILSAAATMNRDEDVDIEDDVPTGCVSDYMIAVTNTTRNDVKYSSAAYGATMIDLGAPGTSVLSTYTGGGTSTLTGSSMASPQVAGAVGFMHAAMSAGFVSYFKNNCADGGVLIKQMILDGTDPLPSLDGITVSGGRLNIYNTAVLVQEYLAGDSLDPNPVSNLQVDTSQWYQATLTWEDPTTLFGGDPITDFVIDISRDGIFHTNIPAGLESFTDYGLLSEVPYQYSFVTRLTDNDSTSSPANITVISIGGDCMNGDV